MGYEFGLRTVIEKDEPDAEANESDAALKTRNIFLVGGDLFVGRPRWVPIT